MKEMSEDKWETLHRHFDEHRRLAGAVCAPSCFCWDVEVLAAMFGAKSSSDEWVERDVPLSEQPKEPPKVDPPEFDTVSEGFITTKHHLVEAVLDGVPRTWVGWLNFLVLQWFFWRLAYVEDLDTGKRVGWAWLVKEKCYEGTLV